jgi:hypothetical protein
VSTKEEVPTGMINKRQGQKEYSFIRMIDEFSTDVKHVTLTMHIYSLYTSFSVNLYYYLKERQCNGSGGIPEEKIHMESMLFLVCAIINLEAATWIALVSIEILLTVQGSKPGVGNFFEPIPAVSEYR